MHEFGFSFKADPDLCVWIVKHIINIVQSG